MMVSIFTLPRISPRFSYYFFDRNPQMPPGDPMPSYRQIGNITFDWPDTSVGGFVQFPFLIAGIDPLQEAALVGLDQTMVAGKYLQETNPWLQPSR